MLSFWTVTAAFVAMGAYNIFYAKRPEQNALLAIALVVLSWIAFT
jgi:hypothetical protein